MAGQKSGMSALTLQRDLGLGSYKTAWSMLHKMRLAMVRPGRERLSGNVEVDEPMSTERRSGWATHPQQKPYRSAAQCDGARIGVSAWVVFPIRAVQLYTNLLPSPLSRAARLSLTASTLTANLRDIIMND